VIATHSETTSVCAKENTLPSRLVRYNQTAQ
jgi:hypothetical protein